MGDIRNLSPFVLVHNLFFPHSLAGDLLCVFIHTIAIGGGAGLLQLARSRSLPSSIFKLFHMRFSASPHS